MRPTRPALGLALAALAATVAWPAPAAPSTDAAPAAAAAASPRWPVQARFDCKPQGPVAVRFEAVGTGLSGEAQLALDIRPIQPMQSLAWWLELSGGARMARGAAGGTIEGAFARDRVQVKLPLDGRACEVTLVVVGELGDEGTGEPVEVRRTLRWGKAPRVAAEHLAEPPEDGRARTRIAAVPVRRLPER